MDADLAPTQPVNAVTNAPFLNGNPTQHRGISNEGAAIQWNPSTTEVTMWVPLWLIIAGVAVLVWVFKLH